MTNEDMNSLMERYKKQLIEFEKRTTFPRPSVDEAESTSEINITQNNVQLNQSPISQNSSNIVEIRSEEPLVQSVNSSLFESEEIPQIGFELSQQRLDTAQQDSESRLLTRQQTENMDKMSGPRPQAEIPLRTQQVPQGTVFPQRPIQPQPSITENNRRMMNEQRQMNNIPQQPTVVQRTETVENEIHRPEFLNVPELSPSRIRLDNQEGIIRGQNLSRSNTPESSELYRQYAAELDKKGFLRVETVASTGLYPVGNSRVVVYKNINGQNYYIYDLFTDASGILDNLELPAPNKDLSTSPDNGGVVPYATYNIYVEHPNFAPVHFENVPIFDGIVSIQSVEMIPVVNNGTEPTSVRVTEREPRL